MLFHFCAKRYNFGMVNYPVRIKRVVTREKQISSTRVSSSDRGMVLEGDVNRSNEHYRRTDRAVVYKKPTPVTIVNVDYPRRSAARITEAYFKVPSTTDYNGIYRGKYIDFEAKECRSRTSFPIKSIHPHQIQHLDAVSRHGAVAFVLIRFVVYDETYYVIAEELTKHIRSCGRSSIPYAWFQQHGYRIKGNYLCPIDYLSVIDILYFQGE